MDLTVVAIPAYVATMGAEYLVLRRRAQRDGPTAATYERRDTLTSLAMGTGSLIAPLVLPKLLAPFTPGNGKLGRAMLATVAGAVAVTTVADVVARRAEVPPAPPTSEPPDHRNRRARRAQVARSVAKVGGITAVAVGGIAATTWWKSRTDTHRLWPHRVVGDLGSGPVALLAAVLGWDFIYYWNHRFQHESRFMWAIHVVHHSSEHYNLSTALRQPVFEVFGSHIPYGVLCLVGIRPELVEQARALNLLYQYWIHTETIRTIGRAENVLNTASHHRVHHGSNRQYLDRNHGSIFIVWDKLFGTFEPERERVRYGLTTNIRTFKPWRVATHEHRAMLADVGRSRTWRTRLSHVLRGPGWKPATSSTVSL